MNCPNCIVELKLAERQGIEIDYCPQCRGVWLDRGELDKIIERSVTESVPARPTTPPAPTQHGYAPHRYDDDDDRYQYGDRKRRKKGFLGDLFDFD